MFILSRVYLPIKEESIEQEILSLVDKIDTEGKRLIRDIEKKYLSLKPLNKKRIEKNKIILYN